ncbi:MAG: molybdenum cofactor guanylyltransferase MobA [Alphaproteobacteria bacterium]|nr:molybdenum cofactor guanylyltransferase MobA [Alphaproteobacteria bacterium]
MRVAGVILAGGQSRRMGGGDKCLRLLGGTTILRRIVDRASSQVASLVLNANGDPARFAAIDLPVVSDSVPGHAGPLAGVLAGLDWAAVQAPQCSHVASFAGDAPFLPRDLVARFIAALGREGAQMAAAASGGRTHPVFGLWPVALRDALRHAIVEEGIRKVDQWTARYALAVIDYPAEPFDPFFNTNRPEDLELAERLTQRMAGG